MERLNSGVKNAEMTLKNQSLPLRSLTSERHPVNLVPPLSVAHFKIMYLCLNHAIRLQAAPCDGDREHSDRRFAEPREFHPPPVKTTRRLRSDTRARSKEPYLFWSVLRFFPLSNELRKHRVPGAGMRGCVGESWAQRLAAESWREWKRVQAIKGWKPSPHPFTLSSLHFLTP